MGKSPNVSSRMEGTSHWSSGDGIRRQWWLPIDGAKKSQFHIVNW